MSKAGKQKNVSAGKRKGTVLSSIPVTDKVRRNSSGISRNIEKHLRKGYEYLSRDDIDSALREFNSVLKNDPENKNACRGLGFVMLAQTRLDEALVYFKKTLNGNPDDYLVEHALEGMGTAYQMKKDYASAVKSFEKVMELNPANMNVHRNMGLIYREQDKRDFAIREFKEVLKIDPDDIVALQNLGSIYSEENKYTPALRFFKKMAEVDPDNPEAHRQAGLILQSLGDKERACAELKMAVSLSGDDIFILMELAKVSGEVRDFKLMNETIKKIAVKKPGSPTVYKFFLDMYRKQKKYSSYMDKMIEYSEKRRKEDMKDNRRFMDVLQKLLSGTLPERKLSAKIIKTPSFIERDRRELDYSLLLPLGMAQVVSYLRANGIFIEQDDLYIRVNYDNRFGVKDDKTEKKVFFDEKRVRDYCSGSPDPQIESIMENMDKRVALKGYRFILLSVSENCENVSAVLFASAYARYIKKRYKAVIIAGGFIHTLEELIRFDPPSIDYIIKETEGVKTLFKLLMCLNNGIDPRDTNIFSFHGKKVITCAAEKISPILPYYKGLPIELYRYSNILLRPRKRKNKIKDLINEFNRSRIILSPLRLMEGCPYECIFCSESGLDMSTAISPEKAVEYISIIREKYGVTNFFLLDNTINVSSEYVNEFCDRIIDRKLDILWCDSSRADNLDRKTLVKMRKAGCIRLIYGIETASPRLLKYVNKQISIRKLEDVLRWSDEAGIWTGIEIICGFPHETKDDLDKTIEFLKRNNKYINSIYYNQFDIRKPSKLFLYPERYGISNIFEVNWYKQFHKELINYVRYGYDEINGLKWEDKWKWIVDSYNYVYGHIDSDVPLLSHYEKEHFLFFLYSKLKKKKDIINITNKVREYFYVEHRKR